EDAGTVDHFLIVVADPAQGDPMIIQPGQCMIPIIVAGADGFPCRPVFGLPHVAGNPRLQAPRRRYADGMPHPTVIGDANAVWADGERSVEIVEIMNRSLLSPLIACRPPRGQQGSGGRIGHVEPVPGRAMNGDYSPRDLGKGERERDCFRVVSAAVERKRHLAGAEINNLSVAPIIMDDCREMPTRRIIQASLQDAATPGLVIGFRSKTCERKALPLAGAGIKLSDPIIFRE